MSAQISRKPRSGIANEVESTATVSEVGLRADALRNRDRILAAAREAYRSKGIDVPMTTIARHAGVGVATLYRRFPTRACLVTEVFAEQLALCATALDEALQDPDPWHGLCTVIGRVCAMQASNRGFTAAFLSQFPDAIDLDREHSRAAKGLSCLVRQAKDAGQLREDFDLSDITLLFLANSGIVVESQQETLAASQRLVGYILQSFRADHTAPLPPPAPLELPRSMLPRA